MNIRTFQFNVMGLLGSIFKALGKKSASPELEERSLSAGCTWLTVVGQLQWQPTRSRRCWQSLKAFVLLTTFDSSRAAVCEFVSVLGRICSWVVKFQLGEFAIVRACGFLSVCNAVWTAGRAEGFTHSPVQLAVLFNVLAYIYFFHVLFYQYV